jgi:hypothetical protein
MSATPELGIRPQSESRFPEKRGQIPVVHGSRHALRGVKTEYVKFDAGHPVGKFSDMAHVDEPGATSDAELDNGDRL